MSWGSDLYGWLFGQKRQAIHSPNRESEHSAISSASGAPGADLYAHAPDAGIGHSQQHRWLFDEGVLHWNQHRSESDFKPVFAGLNFVREAAKSRLWGRPADLAGDERIILSGVDWRFADLQGCILVRADLRHAKMQGANLRSANLSGANLSGADLTDSDLRGAILDGAILARASLVKANLSGASLKGANFAWADMRHLVVGVRNLQEANTFGALRDGVGSYAPAIEIGDAAAARPFAP